jgi:hypothetical protein
MRIGPRERNLFLTRRGQCTPFTWSGNAMRCEVEGDARSGGVPKNSVECKKPREQGEAIPAKDRLPPKHGSVNFGPSKRAFGITGWKSRERGDLRLETGIAKPLSA